MKRIVYYLLLLTVMTIVFMSCRDEEVDVCIENPCECAELPNADFRMYKEVYTQDSNFIVVADTFLTNRDIFFEALEEADSYEWKIGADPRIFTEKNFYLYFDENAIGDVSIRLITKRIPNLECFPEDDGIDTIYKTVHFFDVYNYSIVGDWKGVSTDNLLDTFIVTVNSFGNFENFPKNCHKVVQVNHWYKNFMIDDGVRVGHSCNNPTGSGNFDLNKKEITIDYEVYNEDNTERIKKQFKGIKLE